MGLAVAAALLVGFALSTLAYRFRILRVPGEPVVARMERELNLTPAQRSQVRDIMRDARLKIIQSQREFRRQRRQAFLDALRQIRSILTPKQQEIFDSEFAPRWNGRRWFVEQEPPTSAPTASPGG
jgi:Spy/CpxP family protein refolding chaperone